MGAQQRPIRRGDVYWAIYAFPREWNASPEGTRVEKQRPVLIVQNNADNENKFYPIVQAAPITTQKTKRVYEQDVLLPPGEANFQQTSKVLLGLTQPFLKARLGQKLGRVSPARMREVDVKLLRLFGFVRKHR
jgi:mRNA-degrading endonuclease toxin of MazEF toxin-antitoxin module